MSADAASLSPGMRSALGPAARRLLLADDAYARGRHAGLDRATLAGLEWHRLDAFAAIVLAGAPMDAVARVLDLSLIEITALVKDANAAGLLPPDT